MTSKAHLKARVQQLLLAADAASSSVVTTPEQLRDIFAPMVLDAERENFAVLALDNKRRVVDTAVLTIGNDRFCIVDSRQIFRWALTRKRPVDRIAICHNHPSGDVTPSQQDRDVTYAVKQAGQTIGIPLLDHIIIGQDRATFTTFALRGDL